LGVKTLCVPLGPFESAFGQRASEVFPAEFDRLEGWAFATRCDDYLRITELGRLFIDTVSSLFFSASESSVPHPEEPEIRDMERSVGTRLTALALA
jgi:coproporphyrinogen III oxidase-like Fe-S oxidoreductase